MLINRYIELKYEDEIQEHLENKCCCKLKEGEKGMCRCGKYIEGMVTPQEYLKDINDPFYNIQYGTYIRTELDDMARIKGVEKIGYKIYLILDRVVDMREGEGYAKTDRIRDYDIEKFSNNLKDLVKKGDIVNGHKILRIAEDKLWYGYFGNEFIHGDVKEVLTKKDYINRSILG